LGRIKRRGNKKKEEEINKGKWAEKTSLG